MVTELWNRLINNNIRGKINMLKGQKVNIRPMETDDLELLYKWNTEQEHMGDYMGANMAYKDIYIENIKNNFSDYYTFFAIIEDKENKPIGIIEYHSQKNNQGVGDIGIMLAIPETRGKGIGEEALELFVDYLFKTRVLARIQFQTRVENIAMRSIGEKVGFTVEGILRSYRFDQGMHRDYYMIAMTKEDWINRVK